MKEFPIIFSTPMVQAILEGRKIMTRRLNKLTEINENPKKWTVYGDTPDIDNIVEFINVRHGNPINIKCPFGEPGDLLYVRETWKPELVDITKNPVSYYYLADNPASKSTVNKFKPSIHMPKAAARIWLQVKEVRIERLHKITLVDIESEGIQNKSHEYASPYHAFENIWSKINGEDSWADNPWVWVITFEVLSTTGKPDLSEPKH